MLVRAANAMRFPSGDHTPFQFCRVEPISFPDSCVATLYRQMLTFVPASV
jgi:hypothetical protein